jgi:hypothetical protein
MLMEYLRRFLRKPSRVSRLSLSILPVELLAFIFVLFSSGEPDNGFLPYPAWLPIAHVCHYWRTVALSHAQLWTSITPGFKLSLPWIKVFMERSQTMLMDFSFLVRPVRSDTRPNLLHHKDIILLLEGFTRVRSLCLTGSKRTISPVIDSLCHSLPIQSLSLCLDDGGENLILPDDLFGGKAPIRYLQFISNYSCHLVAPVWLLRNVAHFTSTEVISDTPTELMILRQMPALTHVEIQPYKGWTNDMDHMVYPSRASISPIPMPQLMNLVIHAHSANTFIQLDWLLLSRVDAKRRLELVEIEGYGHHSPYLCSVNTNQTCCLSKIAESANGFKHIQISGAQTEGWCRLWTGDAHTTWEDAQFSLSFKWTEFQEDSLHRFIKMCYTLGVAPLAWVHRLMIDSPHPSLPISSWWKFLWWLP